MKTQAYLLSAIVLVLAMVSIALLTVPVYVEPYVQLDSEYLIYNQRDVNYQIFTILDGLISIVSHNDTAFDNYVVNNREKIESSNDFYDNVLLPNQSIFNDVNSYFNSRIKGHLNVIKNFFDKDLFKQDTTIRRDCTYIYTSSKMSNKSSAFINVSAAGIGYSICGDGGFKHQVIHKVNVKNLHVISGPISIEDVYISIDFVISNRYIVDNKVILDFNSTLYRDIIVEMTVSNQEEELYRDYVISFDSSMNLINMRIAVPMLKVLDRGKIEFRIKIIVNNDLAMRLVIFVSKK